MGGLSDSFGSNTDILVAVVAGAVILLEAVIIVILFCALWHQNSKIRCVCHRKKWFCKILAISDDDGGSHPGKYEEPELNLYTTV